MTKIIAGAVARPVNDGEDWAGRVLKNTAARLRVTAVYSRANGEDVADVSVIRPGGMWARGGRMMEVPLDSLTNATL